MFGWLLLLCVGADENDGEMTLMPIEREENAAATNIQRIARGRQARHYVEQRRRRYNRAATKIQARARGMRDRRRVTWAWKLHFASIAIQRVVRGRLGRVRVSNLRKFLKDTRCVAACCLELMLQCSFPCTWSFMQSGMGSS